MRNFRRRLAERDRFPRRLWHPVIEPEEFADGEWQKHFDVVSTTLRNSVFGLLGYSAFCLVTLGQPDEQILKAGTFKLPIVGNSVSTEGFMLIGPWVLIALTLYMHIYVGRWLQLKQSSRQERLSPPYLFNLNGRTSKFLTSLFFYWVPPAVLVAFAFKGAPFTSNAYLVLSPAFVMVVGLLFLAIRRKPESNRPWGNLLNWSLLSLIVVSGLFFLTMQWLAYSIFGFFEENPIRAYDLQQADFEGSNLRHANLQWANMRNAILSGADLTRANLFGADLRDSSLADANFTEANLSAAELQHANLNRAVLEDAGLRRSHLHNADLTQATLVNADLYNASLYETNMRLANLNFARLTEAKLNQADLTESSLVNAALNKASLHKTNLDRADLTGADLTDAKLSDAINLTCAQVMSAVGIPRSLPQYLPDTCRPRTNSD